MHPVLVYSMLFIALTIGLLFVFERYQLGSFYLLLLIAAGLSALIGKVLTRLFPSQDPMQNELIKESHKIRANQYQREIQFIFNIVQPDPKLQPSAKRISESLDDCFNLEAAVMQKRLQQYFGNSFNINTSQPLPGLIEEIKAQYTNWP